MEQGIVGFVSAKMVDEYQTSLALLTSSYPWVVEKEDPLKIGGDDAEADDEPSDDEVITRRRLVALNQHRHFEAFAREKGLDEGIVGRIPRTDSGFLSSIGATKHAEADCAPCMYVMSSKGCAKGVLCSFCHMGHKRRRHKKKKNSHPCKKTRERNRRFPNRAAEEVDDDLDTFGLETVQLSPSIAIPMAPTLEHQIRLPAKMSL